LNTITPLIFALTVALMSTWSSVATAKQSQLDACEKVVVVTGYWPPTNEMLRPWSRNPKQNPSGWVGENWRNHGFNVYAFFPEFPPDADPMNDPFGSAGWVGSAESDLRVDFQDTSKDFWHIMDTYRPQILITTSRGGQIGWEIEAVEGGHQGAGNKINPALDWKSDQHGSRFFPTQDSIDARSWAAISTYRAGRQLKSQLPMSRILASTAALELTQVQIDQTGTSGNYLSGFIALHGLHYNQLAAHNVAAGHLHVGTHVPPEHAHELIAATLEAVLSQYSASSLACPFVPQVTDDEN
jgi:hypothetical protein